MTAAAGPERKKVDHRTLNEENYVMERLTANCSRVLFDKDSSPGLYRIHPPPEPVRVSPKVLLLPVRAFCIGHIWSSVKHMERFRAINSGVSDVMIDMIVKLEPPLKSSLVKMIPGAQTVQLVTLNTYTL